MKRDIRTVLFAAGIALSLAAWGDGCMLLSPTNNNMNDSNNTPTPSPTPTPTPTPVPCFPSSAPCSSNLDCCSLACVAAVCK